MVYHFHWAFGKGIGTGPGPGSSLIGVGADSDDIPPSSAPALFAERSFTADRLRFRPALRRAHRGGAGLRSASVSRSIRIGSKA